MYNKFIFRSIVFCISIFPQFLFSVAAQPPVLNTPASQVLQQRGEVYFSFDYPGETDLSEIAQTVSIDAVRYDTVYAYANKEGFDLFLGFDLPYVVHVPPGLQYTDKQINMLNEVNLESVVSWNFYPTYDAYESMMAQFAELFPDLYELVELKTLPSGRKILFGVIGKAANDAAKPRFMYTSTMHGDETVGFNLLLRFMHFLLYQHGQDDAITNLVDQLEIWICPNENPDGTYRHDNSTVLGARRFNSNNFDLNRNYPHVETGLSLTNQPETLAMMSLTDSLDFVMSANIHSGFECVNYPWDYWKSSTRKHADHEWWKFVSKEYADTARHYSHGDYLNPAGANFFDGVTHGGDWYVVSGSRQDYMNYYASQRELTLELSYQKLLPTDSLENHWQYNHRSLINYMRQATYGIHGVVADRHEDMPLRAEISIPGYDADNTEVYSSMQSGRFYRPLLHGSYDLKVGAPGYPSFLFRQMEINNYETRFVDVDPGIVSFDPIPVVFPPMVASGESLEILHLSNPGEETISLQFEGITGDDVFDFAVLLKQNFVLHPGEEDMLVLYFRPNTPGQFNGELRFSLGMPHQPLIGIPLEGYAPEAAAILHAITPMIDFGAVGIGEEKILSFTIRNAGNMTLIISNINLSDPAFTIIPEWPVEVRPGTYLDVAVRFLPDSTKHYTAVASFDSNAYTLAPDIHLAGTGIDYSSYESVDPPGHHAVLFPNPASGHSMLRVLTTIPGTALIEVIDSSGNIQAAGSYAMPGTGMHELNVGNLLNHLQPGSYFCRITSGDRVTILKLILIP